MHRLLIYGPLVAAAILVMAFVYLTAALRASPPPVPQARYCWVCPFCGTELPDAQSPHCGEIGCAYQVEL